MNKFAIMLLALTAISAPAFANDTRDVRTTIGYSGSYPELSSENAAFANQPSASMIRKHKGLSDAMQRDAIRSDEKNGSNGSGFIN